MRSGDISIRSHKLSVQHSAFKQQATSTIRDQDCLRIEGSPISKKGLLPDPVAPAQLLKAPTPAYAYQVSQLTNYIKNGELNQRIESPKVKKNGHKVIVADRKGAIHHSTSKEVLNDDMREVFSVDSKLA